MSNDNVGSVNNLIDLLYITVVARLSSRNGYKYQYPW